MLLMREQIGDAAMKSLIPWSGKSQTPSLRDDAHDPFTAFRRDVERVFDDFFGGLAGRGFGPPSSFGAITPDIDVGETDSEVVIAAEIPGLDEKDFDVMLSGDLLTIKGEKRSEREQKNGDSYYIERRFGSFSRSVRLPFVATDEKVDASYDKGVLTIRVQKPKELQQSVRRIDVKSV
jgi:HSP20 family protein